MRTPITLAAALVLLAVGCDLGAIAPIEAEVGEPMHLAVPKPVVRGFTIADSRIQMVEVGTAAAVFNDPESWGVNLTGSADGVEFEESLVLLTEADGLTFVSSNEANFTVDYSSPILVGNQIVEVCAQMVHITAGGDKYLGSPDCDQLVL